jgi:hypothetical protein
MPPRGGRGCWEGARNVIGSNEGDIGAHYSAIDPISVPAPNLFYVSGVVQKI